MISAVLFYGVVQGHDHTVPRSVSLTNCAHYCLDAGSASCRSWNDEWSSSTPLVMFAEDRPCMSGTY